MLRIFDDKDPLWGAAPRLPLSEAVDNTRHLSLCHGRFRHPERSRRISRRHFFGGAIQRCAHCQSITAQKNAPRDPSTRPRRRTTGSG